MFISYDLLPMHLFLNNISLKQLENKVRDLETKLQCLDISSAIEKPETKRNDESAQENDSKDLLLLLEVTHFIILPISHLISWCHRFFNR